jgi:hypothetical protein
LHIFEIAPKPLLSFTSDRCSSKDHGMKNLWQPDTVQELKTRLALLQAGTPRLWGKMTPGQAVAHCAIGMELALGDRRPPRMLIGRLIGGMIKSRAFQENEPMRRNSPTIPGFAVTDNRDLDQARDILCALIDRFAACGSAGCTTHPHSFFGYLTPDEWSMWMYKHIDHHLQQFGV